MKEKIIQAIRNLDDEQTLFLVRKMIEDTSDITLILDVLNAGMEEIGKLYESGTYYIADLIMAGYIYRCVLDMEEIRTFLEKKQNEVEAKGSIVICTVKGDIHDIGKDIFVSLARSKGFSVYDLGVDIKPEQILDFILNNSVDILAMSGIITESITYMKKTLDLLASCSLKKCQKILLGGVNFSKEIRVYIGADYAAASAKDGLQKCIEWINEKNNDSK